MANRFAARGKPFLLHEQGPEFISACARVGDPAVQLVRPDSNTRLLPHWASHVARISIVHGDSFSLSGLAGLAGEAGKSEADPGAEQPPQGAGEDVGVEPAGEAEEEGGTEGEEGEEGGAAAAAALAHGACAVPRLALPLWTWVRVRTWLRGARRTAAGQVGPEERLRAEARRAFHEVRQAQAQAGGAGVDEGAWRAYEQEYLREACPLQVRAGVGADGVSDGACVCVCWGWRGRGVNVWVCVGVSVPM
jgi:hypothetical protein